MMDDDNEDDRLLLITYQHGNKYFDSHDSKRDNNYNKK